MASRNQFDITSQANGMDAGRPAIVQENIYPDGQRPSRDIIIRNYNAKDAQRARNARMNSQEQLQNFLEREERTQERIRQRRAYDDQPREQRPTHAPQRHMSQQEAQERAREIRASKRMRSPMTTQESHDRTQVSREAIEMERARRDVFSNRNMNRTSNREIIDGRGSIDSRAFNERNELVGYSIDLSDRPDPIIDVPSQQGKWNSQAGQGFSPETGDAPRQRRSMRAADRDLGRLSDTISGQADYRSKGVGSGIPLAAKLLIVLIAILLAVLIYLLFF